MHGLCQSNWKYEIRLEYGQAHAQDDNGAKRVYITSRRGALDNDVNCFLGRCLFEDVRDVVSRVKLCC